MKKTRTIILILSVLIIAVIVNAVIITSNNVNIEMVTDSKNNAKISLNPTLGKNIYSVENINNLNFYDKGFIEGIDETYEKLKEYEYTFKKPLIIYNLYGTNCLSFNLKFTTKDSTYLRYTITINDDDIADYTSTLKNNGTNNLTTEHEYQLIGFVPGYENILKLELINSQNKVINTKKIKINMKDITILSEVILPTEEGKSTAPLSNGLYAVLGNDAKEKNYFSLYDNTGVIRSEFPITSYRSHCLLFKDNIMYYSNSEREIIALNNLGKVVGMYGLGEYSLHHDYVFDNDGNLIILSTKTIKDTVEDTIIKLNLKTREVTELIDFETVFQSFVDDYTTLPQNERELDWFHANSVEYVDGDVIISSRETSSIMKFTDIDTNPKLKYIISDKKLWEGTAFEDYVYEKVGDFTAQGGQHGVRYIPTDIEGEYYLYFYNNNFGNQTTRPKFDYSSIGINNKKFNVGDKSYYYMYKVNENKKTFELVDILSVEYSGIVSSTQLMDNGNLVINSGVPGIFAEYDKAHKLIRKFKVTPNEIFVYRVLKYDFNDFWFVNN